MVRAAQRIFDQLEALPCPTVAIINGFALGGGLELALACRYRVGIKSDKFSIGLPEVMLGIHPGFGGTVRAVRIAGVRTAMEMMLTGKTLRADKAKRAGFVDRLVFPRTPKRPHASSSIVSRSRARRHCSIACCPGRWCAASSRSNSSRRCAPRRARNTIPRHTPSSTCGRNTARAASGLRSRSALHRRALPQ